MLTKKSQAEIKRAQKAQARTARIAKMTRNILALYARSTHQERAHGMQWYSVARALITETATRYGIDAEIAIAVCAVLSPNNSWTGNLRDLDIVLRTFATNRKALVRMAGAFDAAPGKYKPRGDKGAFSPLALQTYPMFALKAYRILRDKDARHLKETARKTFAFRDNIARDDSPLVTVDFHAYNIANKTNYASKQAPPITARIYGEIAEAYANAARAVGIAPKQIQAITWTARRNELDRREIRRAHTSALAKVRVNRMKRERALYASA